jgi:hypothetical protein
MSDYVGIVSFMKKRHRLRIRRWRQHMSGRAWRVRYNDGRVINWIESPRPRTPISLAVFLHEVGHHAIGFRENCHRCEEEYHAWAWALAAMRRFGVEPDARVHRRIERSMRYAVDQDLRRGITNLPGCLGPFIPKAA